MTIETTDPATDEPVPANLVEALARVQAAIPDVEKDRIGRVRSEKANYTYRYADLSAVTDAILPLLGQNGLAWVTQPLMTEKGFVLRYTLLHSSGEKITGDYPLPDPARTPPQQVGSALTYARRYCLCAVTGVAPGEDDDDAAAAENAWRPDADRSTTRRNRSSGDRPLNTARKGARGTPADRGSGSADTPEPPDGDGDDEAENAGRAGAGTIRRMMAMFGGAGFRDNEPDRARRLEVCGRLVGHRVESTNELSEAEARQIIDAFGENRRDVSGWLARLLDDGEDDAADDGSSGSTGERPDDRDA